MSGKKNRTKLSNKILANANPEHYFMCIDGSAIKNLLELADSIGSMSDDSFYYHVTSDRNDFSNWVRDIFNQNKLSEDISKANGRLETQAHILRFLMKELTGN